MYSFKNETAAKRTSGSAVNQKHKKYNSGKQHQFIIKWNTISRIIPSILRKKILLQDQYINKYTRREWVWYVSQVKHWVLWKKQTNISAGSDNYGVQKYRYSVVDVVCLDDCSGTIYFLIPQNCKSCMTYRDWVLSFKSIAA